MTRSLRELDGMLDYLESQLPRMIAGNADQDDFWAEFAGESEVIEDSAGDHAAHVRKRIDRMLVSRGLIPPDDGS